MTDRAFLALAVVGCVVSVAVHVTGWTDSPTPFFGTFAVLVGCLVVWWAGLRRVQLLFPADDARSMWKAVMAECPRWVEQSYFPLVAAALPFWLVLMLRILSGDRTLHDDEWARMMSVFTFFFYFYGAAFLWASIRKGTSVAT
jgi:hypothetical protein